MPRRPRTSRPSHAPNGHPRWRSPRLIAAFTALAAAVLIVPAAGTAHADPTERFHAAPGPLGPITVIGDSVMLGGIISSPTLVDQLAARGWGPVRARAGEGYSTGAFSTNATWKATYWIEVWRQSGWDPVDVVVNLGANDSGRCGANVTCAHDAIVHLVDAIGPGHRIWWPKITRFYTYTDQQNAWNAALDQVAAERSGFFTWDWPTEMRTGGYSSPDMTHLSADSYRKRSLVMSREITADLAVARRIGGDTALPAAAGVPSRFVPSPPRRVLDTRGGGARLDAGASVTIDMRPYVPAGATAVAVGLTSDGSADAGFLTGYPCDGSPGDVSNVNHAAGVPRGAMAVVPLSAGGTLCVFTRAAGHVIVDLQGAFVPGPGGVGFAPLATPERLLDTRTTGRAPVLQVTAPAGASAVAVNLTATGAAAPGWLKAYPCDTEPPEVSNVNYFPGETVASLAFVPVSPAGTFCVQSLVGVDVIVDITGTFGPDAPLRFVPATPTRVLDTRTGLGGWAPIHGSGQTIDTRVVPEGARAVTGTLTFVAPMRPGWLKAYGCGTQPETSNVNALPGTVMANAATLGVSDTGRLCITALAATNTLFDVTGWWVA